MKEGWGKFSLMDICNVTTGKHDANHAEENGKYRFYTCSSQYVYCNTKRYEGECIILPGNGVNVGESYYFNGEFDAYQRTYVIDKIDKKIIIPMYLYYHLQNNWKSKGVAKQYGSATNYIKIGNFKDYIVTIPQSLSEQQSIVDYLDSAFAKIDAMKANAEKALNEAKALFQASLKEMLEPKEGWEYKKLDDICYSVEDGDWIESKDQSTNGIRLIQTGNIGNGCYKDKQDSAKYISEETFKRLHCTEIFKGDILVSRLPDPVGRACILPDLGCRCITAVDCSILRIRKNLACNAWITYFMQSQAYFSIIKAQCTGSTRLRITRKKLAEILVPVPPLSEQQRIVATLDSLKSKVDRLQENYNKISQECDALKQANLRQVFE